MARYEFKLPDIGEGIAEAEIVAWHVKVGDSIAEDQQIADMMTDKATVEMESPVAGKVIELAGEVGDQIPIGSVLAVIETEGADRASRTGARSRGRSAARRTARPKPRLSRRRKFRRRPSKKSRCPRPAVPRTDESSPKSRRRKAAGLTSSPRPPCALAPAISASILVR